MRKNINIIIRDKESIQCSDSMTQFQFSIYSRHFFYSCDMGTASVTEISPDPNNYNQPEDWAISKELGVFYVNAWTGPDLQLPKFDAFWSSNLDEHIMLAGFIAGKFF